MADTTVKTSDAGQRLSVTEKIGYGLGDTAANFIFQTMVMFQLAFYTDTFGITAAAAGTLLVVVRVWDAVFDPVMGVLADRTSTRWGKFRPWVLWTAVPFGIMGFLTFMTPDLSPGGKLVYAYATYIALMMVYSANNLPYSAAQAVAFGLLRGDDEDVRALHGSTTGEKVGDRELRARHARPCARRASASG